MYLIKNHQLVSLLILVTISPTMCKPTSQISSCLSQHSVTNFTTFSTPTDHQEDYNNDDSTVYYKLLNLSIFNLRFSRSSVPKPAAIVLPTSLRELIDTVTCCREGGWEIRVRSGGHSYEGASSVGTDGVPFLIIDLMNLNRVQVDLQSQTAWVQGGATLGETYHAIAEASTALGFSAGSCPTVGVGGHISGGGFGLLSRKYGLAADNVVDALLIDADGRLLDRESMGEEVFWAIRGGGGGIWGIVYAWKIKLVHVPLTVTSFVVSRAGGKGRVAALVDTWQTVAPDLERDFYLSVFVGAGLPDAKGAGISATFKGFFLGSSSRAVSIMNQVFPELGIREDDCKEMNWIESILFFSGLSKGSSISDLKNRFTTDKLFFKAKSDYVRSKIPLTGIHSALNILENEPKGYVIMDPYGGIMSEIGSESIPFPHRKTNLFTIQYLVEWHDENDSKSGRYIDWIRGFYNAMTPYVSKNPRAAYVNYVDFDIGVVGPVTGRVGPCDDDDVAVARVWGEKYFLGNYERLVRAKSVIDPDNVFRNQQGIPPLSRGNVECYMSRSDT